MTFINSAPIQRAFQNQRSRIDNATANFGRERRVAGSLLIEGIGRTGIDVRFPVVFVTQPVMVFGQQLDVNEHYDISIPPQVEATVSRWTSRQADPNNVLWTGCRILATTRGHTTQRQILTWVATGIAIDADTAQLGSTMDSI